MILSPEQCRAGRAWLDLKQDELARLAGVSLSTVRDFEAGRRQPIRNNLQALCDALHRKGITPAFDEDGNPSGLIFRLTQ